MAVLLSSSFVDSRLLLEFQIQNISTALKMVLSSYFPDDLVPLIHSYHQPIQIVCCSEKKSMSRLQVTISSNNQMVNGLLFEFTYILTSNEDTYTLIHVDSTLYTYSFSTEIRTKENMAAFFNGYQKRKNDSRNDFTSSLPFQEKNFVNADRFFLYGQYDAQDDTILVTYNNCNSARENRKILQPDNMNIFVSILSQIIDLVHETNWPRTSRYF